MITFTFLSRQDCLDTRIHLQNLANNKTELLEQNGKSNYDGNQAGLTGYNQTAYFYKGKIDFGTKYNWWIDYTKILHHDEKQGRLPIGEVSEQKRLGPYEFVIRDTTLQARYIFVADMDDTYNSVYTKSALEKLDWSTVDGYIHGGDYAYDINTAQGTRGDAYFHSQRQYITKVPYMPVAGNHESFDQGRLYEFRWQLSNSSKEFPNRFYKTRRGPVMFYFVNYDHFL